MNQVPTTVTPPAQDAGKCVDMLDRLRALRLLIDDVRDAPPHAWRQRLDRIAPELEACRELESTAPADVREAYVRHLASFGLSAD